MLLDGVGGQRNSTTLSPGGQVQGGDENGREEPNFVIYNLIKEIDFLVENSNYVTSQQEAIALNNMLDHSSNGGGNNSFSALGSSGGALPAAIIADYKRLL